MSSDKKKKDLFATIFNKKPKEEKRIIPFDENYFEIKVIGGPKHTDLIQVKGSAIQGKEDIKLQCQWFLISPQQDIIKLNTVTSQEYQASIDDVGFKLMIQAEPIIEGRQYEGMPKSVEVGPLELDQTIQEEINELLETEKMTVLLETIQVSKAKDLEEYNWVFPCQAILKVNLTTLDIQFKKDEKIVKETSHILDAQYPQCISVRNQKSQFILKVDPLTEYLLECDDNIQRDIILVVIKTFYGKGLCVDPSIESSSLTGSYRGSILFQDAQLKSIGDNFQDYFPQMKEKIEQTLEERSSSSSEEEEESPNNQEDDQFKNVDQQEDTQIQECNPSNEHKAENLIVEQIQKEKDQTQEQVPQELQQEKIEVRDFIEKQPQQNAEIEVQTPTPQNDVQDNIEPPKQDIEQKDDGQPDTNISQQVELQSKTEENIKLTPDKPKPENEQLDNTQKDFKSTLSQWQEKEREVERKNSKPSKLLKDPQQSQQLQEKQVTKPERKQRKEKTEKMNMEFFMQVNENAKLKQENQQLQLQLTEEKNINKQNANKIKDLQYNLATCTKNYYDMEAKCKQQELTIEQITNEKVFYQSVTLNFN